MSNPLSRMASDPALFQAEVKIPTGKGVVRFGDVMADFQRDRFALINPSLLALACGDVPPNPRIWIEGSKGCSKDEDLAVCLLWLLAFARKPIFGQAAAGTMAQADEIRKCCRAVLRCNAWLASRIEIQSWRILCEATDSSLEIIPSDAMTAHGSRPDLLIFNELSHTPSREFAETALDNASKMPGGCVIVATNAGFLDSWQYEWRKQALSSDYWRTHVFSRPAPWLDERAIQEAKRRNSPSRYLRLFEGVWSSNDGGLINPDDLDALTVLPREHPGGPMPSIGAAVAGLDIGLKNDRTGFTIVHCDIVSGQHRLLYARSWSPSGPGKQVDLTDVENTVLDACAKYGVVSVWYDPHQCQHMAQRLRTRGLFMYEYAFTAKSVNRMAEVLLLAISERTLELYPHDQLRADLLRLAIQESNLGQYKLVSRRDSQGHADLAVALVLSLTASVEISRELVDWYGMEPHAMQVVA